MSIGFGGLAEYSNAALSAASRPRARRATATESRVASFEAGASPRSTRWEPEPHHDEQGAQFASLTDQGQLYYADRIKDGLSHDDAYVDARYSYGDRR